MMTGIDDDDPATAREAPIKPEEMLEMFGEADEADGADASPTVLATSDPGGMEERAAGRSTHRPTEFSPVDARDTVQRGKLPVTSTA
jgi:hypothetical protein